jgi:hypothetical protein
LSTVVDYQARHKRKVKKNPEAFIEPDKSRVYMCQGNRGSGKSSLDEFIAEMNYKMGHTILDLHSASNYESLFWCINLNCKKYYDRKRIENEKKPIHLREFEHPHCNCDTRYPILLVVPEYVEVDQTAIDEFNGNRFYTLKQWIEEGNDPKDYRIKKKNEDGHISSEPRKNPKFKEWIKIRKLHVPNKGFKNREIFVEELTHILLLGQRERRIITVNPKFYLKIDHKLKVLEQLVREIPEIISSHFKPLTAITCAKLRGQKEPVPFEKFTPQEENYHRVTILLREFGSIASSNLNEEKNQVIVKKAMFGWIKVCRQYRMSGILDWQRFSDVYGGIKDQRDVFIWKRSNIDIFPKEYDWLKKDISEVRAKESEDIGMEYASQLYPNIEDLGDNEMYVLYSEKTRTGKRWKKFMIRMPSFHHRHEDDDFEELTPFKKENALEKGTWRFVVKDKDGVLTATAKDEQNEDKKLQEANMMKIYQTVFAWKHPADPSKKMKDQEIFDKLNELNMLPENWSSVNSLKVFMSRNKVKFSATTV